MHSARSSLIFKFVQLLQKLTLLGENPFPFKYRRFYITESYLTIASYIIDYFCLG